MIMRGRESSASLLVLESKERSASSRIDCVVWRSRKTNGTNRTVAGCPYVSPPCHSPLMRPPPRHHPQNHSVQDPLPTSTTATTRSAQAAQIGFVRGTPVVEPVPTSPSRANSQQSVLK